ncbi:KUP/HAK/KT family potassium transporter [Parapedobacter sp. DT-150]|uniref:KUP/HAK/KT family potassium transporter n=1 Tax=Parapedobacter sp. DT-150 TaxID=3396162 RepID=UPI003F1DB753
MSSTHTTQRLSSAGLLISLGIIFGDIGTSPLYVFKAIIGTNVITADLVLGGVSCIFWTLTLQTTIKYVYITLQADNKGEGGILSLYSLVRRHGRWLIFPAMLGGAALLADGMITPAITISSAIEGLDIYYPHLQTVPVVLTIVTVLFAVQRFGTSVVGRLFGPIMFLWFATMAVIGMLHLVDMPGILKAFNPVYGFRILIEHPDAWLILGAVFLCTTGAEALYSDLGHCGRTNIQVSWIYVKICLLLSYFGQGAWLLLHEGQSLQGGNPFYLMMPEWFLPFGIGIATMAAIIASQAMISGSFTLVSEGVRFNIWPKVKIIHPNIYKGQLYVPSANWMVWIGCVIIVLVFRNSANMEAAYGLAINISFLVTTVMVAIFLYRKHIPRYVIGIFLLSYLTIEGIFFVGNASKITHGGWLTVLITALIFAVMLCWWWARKIKNRHIRFVEIEDYYGILSELGSDESVPLFASHLVYLTSANFTSEVEEKIVYSIIQKKPKRADIYWLVHVDVTDAPYTGAYKVTQLIPNKLIRIDFKLGFRDEQRISLLFRRVVEDLVKNNEVDIRSRYDTLRKHGISGDFRFVVLEKVVSSTTALKFYERIILDVYAILRQFSLSEEKGFGLDSSFVTMERVPLMIETTDRIRLKRLK